MSTASVTGRNELMLPGFTKIDGSVVNLRLSPRHAGEICDWQRLRNGPWHNMLLQEGAHVWDVYNHMKHARQYIPGRDGLMKELNYLLNGVTIWGVHVERQIQITGEDAIKFVDYVISRDVKAEVPSGFCKYVVLCDENGGIINDPVLLRPKRNEFWFSISDSDVLLHLKSLLTGLNKGGLFLRDSGEPSVYVQEIDVAPVQIQGPKAPALMTKLFGEQILDMPYYGLQDNQLNELYVTISRTGFSNKPGFEIYLHDATEWAEHFWHYIMEQGKEFGLKTIAPAHPQRLATGILSYGQDMTLANNPYDSRLGWQVDRPHSASTGKLLTDPEEKKKARKSGDLVYRPKDKDFLGKDALANIRANGVSTRLVGMKVEGRKRFVHYNDSRSFLPVFTSDGKTFVGYVTSIFWHPDVKSNLAFARVDTHYLDMLPGGLAEDCDAGTSFKVAIPKEDPSVDEFGNVDSSSVYLANAKVSEVPFRPKEASGDLTRYTS